MRAPHRTTTLEIAAALALPRPTVATRIPLTGRLVAAPSPAGGGGRDDPRRAERLREGARGAPRRGGGAPLRDDTTGLASNLEHRPSGPPRSSPNAASSFKAAGSAPDTKSNLTTSSRRSAPSS
ncbi:hypothetical protein [Sorangium sp. So ce381]|uniref:hypothetical protein n=1 Tax=Sorangium sp. So ce381 TaxID=3133307 RepID=UPI003F5AE779